MARVNVDSQIWTAPRMKRLAKRCGWSMREVVGTCVAVWTVAYEAKSELMSDLDVDTAAETDGFAVHMVAEDLAERIELGRVRLRGVRERIQYLLTQAERGRLGGLARAANATRDESGCLATAKQTPSERLASVKHPPTLPLDLDLPPDPDLDTEGAAVAAPVSLASTLATEAVKEINRLGGGNSRADSDYIVTNAKALARAKTTVTDLRRVIQAKWKEWEHNDKMRPQFKPSVLLRPSNFSRYLEELEAGIGKTSVGVIRIAATEDYDQPQTSHLLGGGLA